MQTRDEYFQGQGEYRKPGYENKGNYRKAVVIEKNKNNELAVVKLTTKGRFALPEYKNGKSRYNPQIETLDNEGNNIKVGPKFIPTNKNNDMPNSMTKMIKRQCLYGNNTYKESNHNKLKELKKND